MCTLIAAFQVSPRWPLIVAANRDEYLDRPSTPPRLWAGDPAFLAPRDEAAGGTWLGLNQLGLFVGVTNRFGAQRDEHRASRGKLVTEALSAPSAHALHLRLAGLAADRFNAFHLFYADRERAFITWSDGARLHQRELSPGVDIITERSLGGDDQARTELIRAEWEKLSRAELTVDGLPDYSGCTARTQSGEPAFMLRRSTMGRARPPSSSSAHRQVRRACGGRKAILAPLLTPPWTHC